MLQTSSDGGSDTETTPATSTTDSANTSATIKPTTRVGRFVVTSLPSGSDQSKGSCPNHKSNSTPCTAYGYTLFSICFMCQINTCDSSAAEPSAGLTSADSARRTKTTPATSTTDAVNTSATTKLTTQATSKPTNTETQKSTSQPKTDIRRGSNAVVNTSATTKPTTQATSKPTNTETQKSTSQPKTDIRPGSNAAANTSATAKPTTQATSKPTKTETQKTTTPAKKIVRRGSNASAKPPYVPSDPFPHLGPNEKITLVANQNININSRLKEIRQLVETHLRV